MSASEDLQTGIRTAWAANGTLTALCPVARVTFGTLGGTPALPYVDAKVEKNAETEYVAPTGSGSPAFVYKRVTFAVKAATAESAADVVDAIHTAFNAEFAVPNSQNLEWKLDDDTLAELPQRSNAAQQIHEGKIAFLCTLVRVMP